MEEVDIVDSPCVATLPIQVALLKLPHKQVRKASYQMGFSPSKKYQMGFPRINRILYKYEKYQLDEK